MPIRACKQSGCAMRDRHFNRKEHPARRIVSGLNAPLLLGALIVGALLLGALAAPLLAPHNPLDTIMRFVGRDPAPAPYPPGTPGLPLGSDTLRRDMLSRLIYGSRYTLLFCGVAALLRVALGG